MASELPDYVYQKLRIGEDLAARMQKAEWFTRGNREQLEGVIKEVSNFLRTRECTVRHQRVAAIDAAEATVTSIRRPTALENRRLLETVYLCLRAVRLGRNFPRNVTPG